MGTVDRVGNLLPWVAIAASCPTVRLCLCPTRGSQRQTGQPTFLSSGRPLSLSRLPEGCGALQVTRAALPARGLWVPYTSTWGQLESSMPSQEGSAFAGGGGGTQHRRVGIHGSICPVNSNHSINASPYNLISSRGYLGRVGQVMNG